MNDESIRKWCAAHLMVAIWDAPTSTLFDVYSSKSLFIDLRKVRETAERTTPSAETYELIVFESGLQIALAPAGVAWPPDFANSGPLPGLPQVLCWRDFASVSAQIQHVIDAHQGEPVGREVLDMLRYCIALVDGARVVGFDVEKEERRLEGYLEEVEKRRSGPA